MKSRLTLLTAVVLCASLATAQAQMRGRGSMDAMGSTPQGPSFKGGKAKLFGDNVSFSAAMEVHSKGPGGSPFIMPGKYAFDQGKSRFETEMSKMTGIGMDADMTAQMKSMGVDIDKTVMVTDPQKKVSYTVFPGMKAYIEAPSTTADETNQYKVEYTKLADETIDGHPTVKNKVVITNEKGEKQEAVIWNATGLKNFPIKMELTEEGSPVTLQFKDVKLSKPDASEFEIPADFKKQESVRGMIMQEVMRGRGGR